MPLHRARRVLAAGWPFLVAAAAALTIGAAPAAASTGPAFGTPVVLGSPRGQAGEPAVAVAPNGRTAVLWRSTSVRGGRPAFLAAIGPDPEHLGRPTVVHAGARAARSFGDATLVARHDGGFVACFADPRGRGTEVAGCSIAAPRGRFGPLRVITRGTWRRRTTLAAAPRPDGSTVVVDVRRIGGGYQSVRSSVLSPTGRRSAVRRLTAVPALWGVSLASADDGTVAVSWSAATRRFGGLTPTLRVMAPGSTRFGAPQSFAPGVRLRAEIELAGGPSLLVRYRDRSAEGHDQRVVRRLPDGSFGAPEVLPSTGGNDLGGPVVQLPDGTPFAVVGSAEGDLAPECATAGVVGAGPLAPVGAAAAATRLSSPRQIALDPLAVALADGTVVAVWRDAGGERARLEAAVRPPGGVFGPSRGLPRPAVEDAVLAAGGTQAVLAWVVGSPPDGPSRLAVSALRREAPYAPRAPLPRDGEAPCAAF
jgi:hypothetical protein